MGLHDNTLEELMNKLPAGATVTRQSEKWIILDGFRMFGGENLVAILKTYIFVVEKDGEYPVRKNVR